jgi:hypothetical protein
MIKLQKTRIIKSFHRNIATGYDVAQEGVALVYVNEAGEAKVKPSAGVTGEKFAGVSLSQVQIPGQLTAIETSMVAGNVTVTLAKKFLVAGQVAIVIGGTYLTEVAAGAEAAGKFSVDLEAGVVTLDAADAGTTVKPVELKAIYKYAPTFIEAINAQGNGPAGGVTAATYYSVSGVIVEGDVATDQFDVTDNWTKSTGPIFLGPKGIFTLKTGGTELKGANIIEAPVAGPTGSIFGAFLTLNFGPYSGA